MAPLGFFPPKAKFSIIYYSTKQLPFQNCVQRENFRLFHTSLVSSTKHTKKLNSQHAQQEIKKKKLRAERLAQNYLRAMICQSIHPRLIYLIF